MMENKICLECGGSMEGKMQKAKFCSDVCRATHHKKSSKQLGNVVQPNFDQSASSPIPGAGRTNRMPPMQLDVIGQYMVDDLKDKVKDLKEEVKKLSDKNEILIKDNADLLKRCEDTTRTLEAKPSGLGAIMQNPDTLKTVADATMPHLVKMGQPLLTAIAGLLDPDTKHPLMRWINAQPEQVQIDFMNMVGALNNNPDKISENIANISRALMAPVASTEQPKQPAQPRQSKYR